MKTKLFTLFALMLCMGAFLFPTTAYAMSDSAPPTVSAWMNGDILHIEAADSDSGVESVYVDSHRFNYLVHGVIEVNARENHDNKEQITVYAVDFAGNKSSVVTIKNPYYKAESTQSPTQEAAQTTPKPNPTPASTSQPVTSTVAPAAESAPAQSQSSISADSQPFTPDGTGTVMDTATDQDGKEFFTITTADENVFYLVIDRQRDQNGVYLLNAVTEDDLAALAEKSEGSSQSAVPTPVPEVTPTPEPIPTSEVEAVPETESSGNGTIVFILIAVVVAGGAGYYFKIVRPKQQALMDDEDEYEEPDDDDTDYDFEEVLDDETVTDEGE